MEVKFAQVLADQRDHAGVVRARAQFAEDDLGGGDKKLHAKQACTAQVGGDFFGHVLRGFQKVVLHGLGLPAVLVVATFLHVANGLAKQGRAFALADG